MTVVCDVLISPTAELVIRQARILCRIHAHPTRSPRPGITRSPDPRSGSQAVLGNARTSGLGIRSVGTKTPMVVVLCFLKANWTRRPGRKSTSPHLHTGCRLVKTCGQMSTCAVVVLWLEQLHVRHTLVYVWTPGGTVYVLIPVWTAAVEQQKQLQRLNVTVSAHSPVWQPICCEGRLEINQQ